MEWKGVLKVFGETILCKISILLVVYSVWSWGCIILFMALPDLELRTWWSWGEPCCHRSISLSDLSWLSQCAGHRFILDAIGLQCNIHVLKMQQKYIDILRRYIQLVFPSDDNGMKRYGRLLLRLPALRTLTMQISQVFEQFIISDRPDIATLVDTSLHDDVLISMVNG